MSDDAIICVKCQKEESDARKVIECAHCHKSEHFKCKNIIGNAIRKLRAQDYFCSLECHDFYQRTIANSNVESRVMNELHTILAEVRETRSEMDTVKRTIGEVEKFQNFLSDKLDTLLSEVKSVKEEHGTLKTNVRSIAEEQKILKSRVDYLEEELDRVNRAAVSNNAVILGVPLSNGENTIQVVYSIAASLGCQLPSDAVLEARRMIGKNITPSQSKSAPIKVCFKDARSKEDLFAKKKSHGQLLSSAIDPSLEGPVRRIVLRDELTSYGMRLLSETREQKELLEWKFIWPGRNGTVLAKRCENSKIEVVRNHFDLEKLSKSGMKRLRSASSGGSGSPSPPGPSMKR